jgi:hypothetical protein
MAFAARSRISREIWLWYLRADGDGCVNIGASRIPRGKKSQHTWLTLGGKSNSSSVCSANYGMQPVT